MEAMAEEDLVETAEVSVITVMTLASEMEAAVLEAAAEDLALAAAVLEAAWAMGAADMAAVPPTSCTCEVFLSA